MKRITWLESIGEERDLIIAGGGHSAGIFDFKKCNNLDLMTLNDSLYVCNEWIREPDWLIYYDANMLHVLKEMEIPKKTKVIGYNNSMWERIDYDYRMSDCMPAKQNHCIAAKALIIAHDIMLYRNIYLIGIDFMAKGVNGKLQSHLQGDPVGPGKKYSDEAHLKTHIGNLDRTEEFQSLNYSNVFNCNLESKLKTYEHRMPY